MSGRATLTMVASSTTISWAVAMTTRARPRWRRGGRAEPPATSSMTAVPPGPAVPPPGDVLPDIRDAPSVVQKRVIVSARPLGAGWRRGRAGMRLGPGGFSDGAGDDYPVDDGPAHDRPGDGRAGWPRARGSCAGLVRFPVCAPWSLAGARPGRLTGG